MISQINSDIYISVIIPIYNANDSIQKCVESVLKNKFENYELILLDDGSTDNSYEIIKSLDHPKINVYHHKNQGVGFTRNIGIEKARGQFIVFLDSDDYVDEDYLNQLYYGVGSGDIGISGIRFVDNKGEKIKVRKSIDSLWNQFNLPLSGGKIYKRSFLIENSLYFSNFKIGEDLVFNTKCYAMTEYVVNILYVGYNYVENPSSSTHSFHGDLDVISLIQTVKTNTDYSQYIRQADQTFFLKKTLIDSIYYGLNNETLQKQKQTLKEGFKLINSSTLQFKKEESLSMNLVVNFFSLFSKIGLGSIPLRLMMYAR